MTTQGALLLLHVDHIAKIRTPSIDQPLINAADDMHAVQAFLNEFKESPHTERAYRKECERLLLWCAVERKKTLQDLNREDFDLYREWLTDPVPRERWCGPKRPRNHPDWRPFVGSVENQAPVLTPKSVHHAMLVIASLFAWLVQAGYLDRNPVALIKKKSRVPKTHKKPKVTRYIDLDQWGAVKDTILSMPSELSKEKLRRERAWFVFHALYLLMPRANELVKARMGDIQRDRSGWRWTVTGKGMVEDWVPLHDDMLHALKRWRAALGLSALPSQNDGSPLLRALDGQSAIAYRTLWRIVHEVVDKAAERLRAEDPDRADRLKQASAHWFRHSGVSHLVQAGTDLTIVKELARHANLNTTLIYNHAEDEARHNGIARLKP